MANVSEEMWLKDMNNMAQNLLDEGDPMDTGELSNMDLTKIENALTAEAYEKYVGSLQNPQWTVYTRPDALYSRIGLQLECYSLRRSSPSTYENLLNQVSNSLKFNY